MIVKSLSKMSRICKGFDISLKFNAFSTSQSAESTDIDAIFAMLEEEKLIKELKIKQKTAKFEREWELITRNRAADMATRMKGYFQESNEKRAKLFIENMSDLNPFELRYLISILKTRASLKNGVPRDGLGNAQIHVLKQPDYSEWAPANPNWSQQQELVAQLWPLGKEGMSKVFQESAKELAAIHGVDLTAVAAQQQQQLEAEAQAKKEPEKPVAVKEKTHYEIQLTAIDAAQKIKAIKEVRQALNLGLKEAKDLVEKAPCSLKKDVKKEEAEDLKAKLEAAGCTITLL